MKLCKILAIAATLALGAGSTYAQMPQNVPGSPQTLNVGSIIIGTGGNTLKLAPPTSGGASTFTFPASSLTFPASNATGFLFNNGTGGLSWSSAVTNVSSGNLSPIFTSVVNTASSTPSFVYTLSAAAAHSFLGNNTGTSGAPGYVSIGAGDIGSGAAASGSVLTADGSGNSSFQPASGGITLPYASSASQNSGALFQITNTSSTAATPIGITGVASNGVGSYGQATGTGTGIQGDGLGTTSGYGVVGTGAGTAGVLAWATSSGSAVPLKILNSGGSLTDVSSTSWSISSAGVFSGNAAGISLPYGPSQNAGGSGLFTITNSGSNGSGYAVGGQATGGGIGLVAASSSTGVALLAQNTSSGVAISATASGAGPVIKAAATSTNDAIDAYGNVQILGTGTAGIGDHTNASLYVPYGDITVGNHIHSSNSGSTLFAFGTVSNCSATTSSSGGTDAAGHMAWTVATTGNFSAFATVTYQNSYTGTGIAPVVVVSPVAPGGATSVVVTASTTSSFTVLITGSGTAGEVVQANYHVIADNQN